MGQYVNNKDFLEALKKYLLVAKPLLKVHNEECQRLKDLGVQKEDLPKFRRPHTPEYEFVGECLLKIAEHLSYKLCYLNYSYREELVGDAIENAIQYLENFDPDKWSNPFAYYTEIMKYAFWRRLAKEEKHSYIKQKSLESAMDLFSRQGGDDGSYTHTLAKFLLEVNSEVVQKFEDKKAEKKAKQTPRQKKKAAIVGVDKFLVDVVENVEIGVQ